MRLTMSEKAPPSKLTAPLLDWKARKIEDPVARLRFLRTATTAVDAGTSSTRMFRRNGLLAIAVVLAASAAMPFRTMLSATHTDRAPRVTPVTAKVDGTKIWQVETTKEYEDYSNGLRIEKQYAIANRPRPAYRVFERNGPRADKYTTRTNIAGIVFHTTESHIAAFKKEANETLRRAGRSVLAEVQIRRCYNYLIDRFGRVWRVVEESDVAWHAGPSVWADATGVYVNLNESFLGVSFEAETYAKDGQPIATEAQIHSARLLTDMLRAKYNIPASNCATHAQVSVSMASMGIAYHTDWAGNFPFKAMGLPDNYAEPLPSLWTFGFNYDQSLIRLLADKPWTGLTFAEQHVREQAALAGIPAAQYKLRLQQRYKDLILALYGANEEQANES
jgi:hypothetical protein